MKKIFLFLFIFPSLLFSREKENFHLNPVFEKNVGQICFQNNPNSGLIIRGERNPVKIGNENICFIMRGNDFTYYFSDRGYSVVQKNENGKLNRVDFLFPDNQICKPEGENRHTNHFEYYTSKGNFHSDVYEKIIYHDAFPGADLEFSVFGDFVEKKLIITGSDFNGKISFDLKGAVCYPSLEPGYQIVSDGSFFFDEFLKPGNNNYRVSLPVSHSGARLIPEPEYVITRNGNNSTQASSISWLTYLGGTDAEDLFGITLTDDSGIVVVGRTGSANFPTTSGSMQDTLSLSYDAVVTRFDKNGNCVWSTYYGGTNFDGANQVVTIDTTFVIAGMTNSSDLPMLNPTQSNLNGGYDAFILTLSNNGQMIRSTYYGGTGSDQGLCIAKGPSNEIVLAGSATSTDLPFASSGFQGTMAGQVDAFLTVFDDSLNVQWATYYGGSNSEDIHGLCVSPQGEISFVGGTRSPNFSVTADAWQTGLLNQPDNYLVKFGMDGSRHYATFFGGTNNEDANGIISDADGNLYMTGFTYSIDFPIQGNTFQSNLLGQNDVFLSKFDVNGQLVWSSFVGGGGQDVAWGIYGMGKYIFICGETESAAFPVSTTAVQATYAANGDGFVIKMDTSGNMISGTFLGGNGVDALLAIAVDADTSVIACGDAYSTNLAVVNPYQPTYAGAGDGYVVKFGMAEELPLNIFQSENENLISVFPNPSDGTLVVSLGNKKIRKIEILDAMGRVVKTENENGTSINLDIQNLSSGIYLLRITDEQMNSNLTRFIRK